MQDKLGRVKKLGTLKGKSANQLFWSPQVQIRFAVEFRTELPRKRERKVAENVVELGGRCTGQERGAGWAQGAERAARVLQRG